MPLLSRASRRPLLLSLKWSVALHNVSVTTQLSLLYLLTTSHFLRDYDTVGQRLLKLADVHVPRIQFAVLPKQQPLLLLLHGRLLAIRERLRLQVAEHRVQRQVRAVPVVQQQARDGGRPGGAAPDGTGFAGARAGYAEDARLERRGEA